MNLIGKKEKWAITLKGWVVIVTTGIIAVGVFVRFVHPFFAITAPVRGKYLVVEGWLPRDAVKEAMHLFNAAGYEKIITTGGPIYSRLPCGDFKNYAQLAAAVLADLHFDPGRIIVVPAPETRKDRTYAAARALKRWLDRNDRRQRSLDIFTLGLHARRSLILYQMALGDGRTVGVISVPDRGYDPKRWWHYSQGVKTVINEVIGYVYTKFLFHPESVRVSKTDGM